MREYIVDLKEGSEEFTVIATETSDALLAVCDFPTLSSPYGKSFNVGASPLFYPLSSEGIPVIVSITGNTLTTAYNGGEQSVIGYTISIPDGVNLTADDIFCADAAKAKGTDVGTYHMGLTDASFCAVTDDYDVIFYVTDGSLTITSAPVTVVADNKTKVYGTADTELTATVTGVFNNDQIVYSLSRAAGENTGEYTITPTGNSTQGNYTVSFIPGTYTITPAEATVSAVAATKVYGELDPDYVVTVTGMLNGDSESVISYSVNREPGENVGTYTVTPTGAVVQGNYQVTYVPSTLTITRATAVVAAEDKTKVYGDEDPELTATITGLRNGDSDSVVVYTLTREQGEDVGSYTITANGAALQGNYELSFVPATMSITRAMVIVMAEAKVKLYGDADPELTALVSGLRNGDDESAISYTLIREPGEDVGVYAITPAGAAEQGNYELMYAPDSLTIARATVVVTAETKTKVYGDADPEFSATIEGLKNGDSESVIDYSLSREPGENVGIYAITPAGAAEQGNYELIYESNMLTITRAMATVTAENKTKIYGDADPELTAVVGGLRNGDEATAVTYSLSREAGESVGSYAITVSGDATQGNYELSFVASTFDITRAGVTVTAEAKTKIYGDLDPVFTATLSGLKNGDAATVISYTLGREPGEDVGSYAIMPTGAAVQGNYELNFVSANLDIMRASLLVTAETKTKVYGDADPEFTAIVTGLKNGDEETVVSYVLSREEGETVGTYVITVSGDSVQGNYDLVYTASVLEITRAVAVVTAEGKTKVYGDADPDFTATVTGLRNGDEATVISYSLSRESGENVGSYDIIVSGEAIQGNYELSYVPATLDITRAAAIVTAETKTKIYGEADPVFTVVVTGLKNGDEANVINCNLSREDGEQVGTYVIFVSGDPMQGNYELLYVNDTLTISPALLTITLVDSKTYDGTVLITSYNTPDAVSATGLALGDYLTAGQVTSNGATVSSYTYPLNSTITEAFNTYNGIGNYEVSYDLTQNITRSNALAFTNCTALTQSQLYNGEVLSSAAEVNVLEGTTVEYSVNGSDWSATEIPGITNVGSVSVNVRATNPNYDTAYCNYTLTVQPVELTVTANDKTREYGEENPVLDGEISGFVNGEDITVISGEASYSTVAVPQSPVGSYAIVPEVDAMSAANYIFNVVNGSMTVTRATATVTADSKTKIYGAEDPVLTASVSGLKNGEVESVLTYSLNREAGEQVGNYVISVSGEAIQGNYDVLYLADTLTVNPAPLTIAIFDTKIYDGTVLVTSYNTPGVVSATGLVNGDYLTAGQVTCNGVDVSTYSYPSGSVITEAFNTHNGISNYIVSYNIVQRIGRDNALTVSNCTSLTQSRLYNGAALSSTAEVSIAEGTTVEYSADGFEWSSTVVPNITNVGSINVRVRATNSNYDTAYCSYTLTVLPVELMVTANDKTREYGEINPIFDGILSGFVNGEDATVITGTATYSTVALQSSPVGSYAIVPDVSAMSAANYVFSPVNGNLTVTRATVTVTADSKTKVYGEDDPVLTASISGLKNGDAESVINYILNRETGGTVGSYLITASGATEQGNYEVLYVADTLTITQAPLTITIVDAKIYDGNAIVTSYNTPNAVSATGLVAGDYLTAGRVTSNGTAVSTYVYPSQSTITEAFNTYNGIANYAVDYNISQQITHSNALAVSNCATLTQSRLYNGQVLSPVAEVNVVEGTTVEYSVDGSDWSATTVPGITNVGSVNVMVRATNPNYDTAYCNYTLTVLPVELTVTANDKTREFGETNPALDGTVSGFVNGEDVAVISGAASYSTVAVSQSPVGSYAIVPDVSAMSAANYTFRAVNGNLTVTRATATVTAEAKTKVYGEEDPVLTATVSGLKNDDVESVISYTLSRVSGEGVGDHLIIPSGEAIQGNYNVMYVSSALNVTRASATVTAEAKTKVYGDNDPELTAVVNGLKNGDAATVISYTLVRTTGENVGNYVITPAGEAIQGNYEVTFENSTLEITRAMAIVTAEAATKVFGEEDPELTAVVTGLKNGDNASVIAYTTSRETGEFVGIYTISVSGATVQGNYDVNYVPDTFTITKALLTITVFDTKIYDGNVLVTDFNTPDVVSTNGLAEGDYLTAGQVMSSGSSVGTYVYPASVSITNAFATFKGIDNYIVNYNLTQRISRNDALEITNCNELTQVRLYNGQVLTSTPVLNITEGTTVEYNVDDSGWSSSVIPGITEVGSINVSVRAMNPNYETAYCNYTLTVLPVELVVTANSKMREYGEANPVMDGVISGFVNGDGVSVITGTATYSTIATQSSSVGTYLIVPDVSAMSATNYTFRAVNGTLTVTRATAIVTAEAKTKVYGDEDPVLTATVSGLKNGDAETVVTYAMSRVAGENIGNYVITPSGAAVQGNYNVSFVPSSLSITRAQAVVTAEAKTKVYGDEDPVLTAVVSGLRNGDVEDVVNFSLIRESGEDVGNYTIIPAGEAVQGNYEVSYVTSALTITKAMAVVTAEDKTKIYGDADPELTATVTGLRRGDAASVISYTLSREAGEDVGSYVITPAGAAVQGNYEVNYIQAALNITKANVTVTAENKTKVYGDNEPELTAIIAGLRNGDANEVISYTLSRESGESVGVYDIVPVGLAVQGNYEVTYVPATLTITRATLTVTAEDKAKIYGDADPELTAMVSGLRNGDTESVVSYTLSRESGELVGVYAITPAGDTVQGNYNVNYVSAILRINKAALTVTAEAKTKVYGEEDPELTATVSGLRNGDAENVINYNINRVPGENVGYYNIVVSGSAVQGNYDVTYIPAVMTITRAIATVTAEDKTKVYGDADPSFTAVVSGLQNGDAESVIVYALSRIAGEDIGSYTIMPSGNAVQGNYEVNYMPATLTVTRAMAVVTADNMTKVYGDADPVLTATVTGLKNGDMDNIFTYALSRVSGESIGDYVITASGAEIQGNYTVTYATGVLTVTKATAIVTADAKTKVYGDADPELTATVTGLKNGDMENVISYTLSRTAGENIGTCTITATGDSVQGNYNVEYVTGTLTITKAVLTVTADAKTKVYGDADPELTATVTGLKNGDDENVVVYALSRTAGENTGAYTIMPSGATVQGNYDVTYMPADLTITQASLVVTAENKTKVYGDADPEWTAIVTGLKNGDSESVVVYAWNRIPGEDIGVYTITPSGAAVQGNYNVTYMPAELTVTKATAIVTAEAKTKVYGDVDPEFTATVSGLKNGDTEAVITYSLSRADGENIGTYTITVTGATAQGNYDVEYVNNALTITKAMAIVTAENKTKVYSDADPELTATISGLKNGDDESVIAYSLSRVAGEIVGDYTITPSGMDVQGNYEVTYVPAILTITRAMVTVTAEDKSKIYGDADPVFTAGVSGLRNGDAESVISYSLSRTAGENVGSYAITPSGAVVQGNYEVTFVPANLSITRAVATVTANDKTKVYGDANPMLTVTVSGLKNGDNRNVISYTVSREQGENVGTYTITPTGATVQGNYEVVYETATLTITRATLTVTAANKAKTYASADPTFTATVTGLKNGDNSNVVSFSLNREPGESVGTYTITPSGELVQGNYNVVYATGTLTIQRASVVVRAMAKSKIYGDADPAWTATVSGLKNGDSDSVIVYSWSRSAGENVGTYTITPTGVAAQGNYNVTYVSATLTINRASVIVTADAKIKGLGEAEPVLTATVTGLKNNDAASVISYQLSRAAGENIGVYTITVTGAAVQGNYNVSYVNGTLTIMRLLITVTADNKSKTYTDADPTLTATIGGLSSSTNPNVISYSLSREAGENAGEYAIIPTGDTLQGNYRVAFVAGTLTINRAIATVTSDAKSKEYGDPDPVWTASVSGMRNGEPESLITYTLSREEGENVGVYNIMPGGEVNQGNYSLNFVSKKLTITRASARVTADQKTKLYGDPDPEFTVTVTGLKNGDSSNVISYTCTRAAGENVGNYLITPQVASVQGNYNVTYVRGVLKISRTTATVTADATSKIYGEADPVLTATISGLKNGDDESVISYSISRVAGEQTGTYNINVSGASTQGNYNVVYERGIFTITGIPVEVTITGNMGTVSYNGFEQSITGYTVTIPDSVPLTQENIVCSVDATATGTNAGTYYMGLTPSSFSNTNALYDVTFVVTDGKLTINRVAARVKVNNVIKALGDPDPVFTATVVGLKGNDDASVLSYTFTRDPGETVGTYFVYVQGDAVQGNYNVTYQRGLLNIIDIWPSCPNVGATSYSPNPLTDRVNVINVSTAITDMAPGVQVVNASSYYTVILDDDETVVPASYSEGFVTAALNIQSAWRGQAITVIPTVVFYGCESTTPVVGEPLKICVPFANSPYISSTYNTHGDASSKTTLFSNGGNIILKAAVANRDDDKIVEHGFLISTNPGDVETYNSAVAKSASYIDNDTMVYYIGLDSCTKHLYYKPYLILNDCDSTIQYGERKDFVMWHPDLAELTVTPSSTVVAGTEITLNAVATMTVGNWPSLFARYHSTINGSLASGGCNMNTNGNALKTMEEWMHILLDCPLAGNAIHDFMHMDAHDASFRYTWEPIGYVTPTDSSPGNISVTPTQTTTYEGSAVFTYRGMVCKVSRTITVTVE